MRGGRITLVEASKNLKPWRDTIAAVAVQTAMSTGWKILDKETPIDVLICFTLPKPKTVKRDLPTVKPDLDKLVRAALDAITQSKMIWNDDAQVCRIVTEKHYSENPSTWIEVSIYDNTGNN